MTTRTCISPASAIAHSLLAVALALPVQPAGAATVTVSSARDLAEAGLVDVGRAIPGLDLDIRYAGPDNFTAAPVPGYEAPRCYLLAPVAAALARVQADLRRDGFALRIYDCYRPVRAVQAFVAWAHDPSEQSRKALQYPQVDKPDLLDGYIAGTSGHSRAATVDLTLLDCRAGPCTALDMGTGFDFFGARAHTDAPDISAAQRAHRQQLLRAMQRHGFANYPLEWWHYTLQPEPSPATAYDIPVR
ncbi:M15 family metallopeptidase [Stenotrophomonas sp. Marseille-Q5258]|uniref:M15 family metallopeptidase n=1 Tax=Stenotrophomonas sp. Marseille-Q5258 TaxID=2972779 RepID=UPI0021CA516F|nr:M15 family metallopeptidase [Stenotrophomonas sp. Marseille-Q5258]